MTNEFDGKRPIDRVRNEALSFTVGNGGEVCKEMISLGDRLLTVANRSVIEPKLADQVDPGRTDIGVPKVVQTRVLAYGADHAIICQTLLTGKALFDAGWLRSGIDKEAALRLALQAAEKLSAMSNAHAQLKGEWEYAAAELQTMNADAPLLPGITDLTTRTENFIDSARKCLMLVVQLIELFYPKATLKQPWRENAEAALSARFATDNASKEFFAWVAAMIDAVSNFRNAGQHADATKRIIVTGFELKPGLIINAPAIEIVHPTTPLSRLDLLTFMDELIRDTGLIFEGMSALLCDENIRQFPLGIDIRVRQIPDDQARNGVRYVYHPAKQPPPKT